MLLIDMSFLKRGALRTVFTQKNQMVAGFTKSSDFPMLLVERKVKVLDTTTGKITERSVKSLFEKPLRPFVKDKTLDGRDVLALVTAYKFAELKETVIRVKDICFYFTNKGFLLLYKHNIYYKESLRQDNEEIAGFCVRNDRNYAYTIPDTVGDFVKGYLQTPYFIPEIDIEEMKEVEKNVTFKDFTENAALYAIKLKMTGYSI